MDITVMEAQGETKSRTRLRVDGEKPVNFEFGVIDWV